ncbi:MAG TPA: ABC transporter substrate-binding protein [Plasticicumulans sp.]|uniref:ABC transporter substrate-binding protein n=1 Tax=Plasticicumulans sp. TaxID=2307179 RepID=UPI002CD2E8A0|nr:ABC transporter substrate-binding protein [Plasticicumulans sp.]HND99016.1 ABC transporter substrate-binding protein [Plasticicumulans sp.]HNG49309.1 ABC transporter substrate-binding protein [Plasticicumulans sp.]HNI24153.1 ABC transporter substrate-binding protein [Plasticicumulans sp.]
MRRLRLAACLAAVLVVTPAIAAELAIGFLGLADDPRYERTRLEHQFQGQPGGSPLAGAEVAIEESEFAAEAQGLKLRLDSAEAAGDDAASVRGAFDGLVAGGAKFVLVDLPPAALDALAQATRTGGVTLINVSAGDDALRAARCQPQLLHTMPSEAMLADGLAQYLVSRKWRKVLVLVGPRPEDQLRLAAFTAAARRFGLKIVDTRSFRLSNDPRERDLGNVALLTAGEDYDALYIADTDGEFARDANYRGQLPRPTVGSAGLAPEAWHWSWERNGAPQLNNRFLKHAKRPMRGADWAAWVAVKALVEAAGHVPDADPAKLLAFLRGPELVVDGFKGARLSFRAWDGQLRQPVFLAFGNGVAASAPVDGFLHPVNALDTLGPDQPDTQCRR